MGEKRESKLGTFVFLGTHISSFEALSLSSWSGVYNVKEGTGGSTVVRVKKKVAGKPGT